MFISSEKTARVMWLTALIWAACQSAVPWLVGSAMVALNNISGGNLDPYIAGGFYNLFIGPVLVGGIAGYLTVALWRGLPMLRAIQARTVVMVSMGALFIGIVMLFAMSMLFLRVPQEDQPAPGDPEFGMVTLPSPDRDFVTGFFTWILPGLMVGRTIADEIERRGPKWSRRQTAFTAAGWALGFAIGGGLGMAARDLLYAPYLYSDTPGGRTLELLMLLPDAIRGFSAGLIGAWFTLRGIQVETISALPA